MTVKLKMFEIKPCFVFLACFENCASKRDRCTSTGCPNCKLVVRGQLNRYNYKTLNGKIDFVRLGYKIRKKVCTN